MDVAEKQAEVTKEMVDGTKRETWPDFFMMLADVTATRSKDPSTKVGAILVRPDKTVASFGYNGFPRRVRDDGDRYANRDFKYAAVVHAEVNAILNAREDVRGYKLYTTFHPCARCAAVLVQAGIENVVTYDSPIPDRWKADMYIAKTILEEGGVGLMCVPEP